MVYSFKGFVPVVHESSFIHPQASVIGNVIIGKNVYVGPSAVIRGDWGGIVIEDGCAVVLESWDASACSEDGRWKSCTNREGCE
jgi:carbonic anhydrase/acetyltransferase-like protein (isoleucine patch superfamily)